MAIKWIKNGSGYKSACGRFVIDRFIRRSSIEWGLKDVAVPFTFGAVRSRLSDAKDAAQWRLSNVQPAGKPLTEIL